MKTKISLLLFTILYGGSIAFSQVPTINGLILNQKYTKDAIIQTLGTPTYYRIDLDDNGNSEAFYYGTTQFGFTDGILTRASIEDSAFKLYGCVYVGLSRDQVVTLLSPYGLSRLDNDDAGTACISFYNKLIGSTDQYSDVPFYFYFDASDHLININYEIQD